MNKFSKEPLMFINSVNSFNSQSKLNSRYIKSEKVKTKEEVNQKVNINVLSVIDDLLLKHDSGIIRIVQVILEDNSIYEGIIRKKDNKEITLKQNSEEIKLEIEKIQNIQILDI